MNSTWKIGVSLLVGMLLLLLTFSVLQADESVTDDHFIYLPLVFKPQPRVDLSVGKTSVPDPYVAGEAITYTIVITNAGPGTATALTVAENLPNAVLSATYTTTQGTFDAGTGSWLSLTLGSGQTAALTIVGTVSDTFTDTLCNTVLVTPTTALETNGADNQATNINPYPRPITDSLKNPGFEEGHWHATYYGDNGAMAVPEEWIAWWQEGEGPTGPLGAPEIVRVIDDSQAPYVAPVPRIRSGHQAVMLYRWGSYRAGFYQRVEGLPPGATATFSVYGHAWACGDESAPVPYSCGDPYSFRLRAGIDPAGDTEPWSDTVVWSEDAWIRDVYDLVGPVEATVGPDGAITVYIEAFGKWPLKNNDAYFDDAALIVVSQP